MSRDAHFTETVHAVLAARRRWCRQADLMDDIAALGWQRSKSTASRISTACRLLVAEGRAEVRAEPPIPGRSGGKWFRGRATQ